MIGTLIREGHSYHDILWEYSPEEINRFFSVSVRNSNEDLRKQAIAARVGFNADSPQWKRFMRQLDKANKKKGARPDTRKVISGIRSLQEMQKHREAGTLDQYVKSQ